MTALLVATILFCPPIDLTPDPPFAKPAVRQPVPEARVVVIPRATKTPASEQRHRAIAGAATWYRYHQGQAAAGPRLRNFLGKNWRGKTVNVCLRDQPMCLRNITLTDWCACPGGRVIDLDDRDFSRLAPRSRGVIKVKVSRS